VSFVAIPRGGADPRGPDDLSRFFVVLAPAGDRPLRRLSVRRRALPDGSRSQRFLAHVDRISAGPAGLTEDVRSAPGLRLRILAVGRYALARHSDHVHLAYALARACGRGALASALGVTPGASFVLSIAGRTAPPTSAPRAAGAPLAPATPDRLDVIGAEVALFAGDRHDDHRPGHPVGRHDRVGEALVGALLRRGPRPRVASFARAHAARKHGGSRRRTPRHAS
jgi:hypothetical protein